MQMSISVHWYPKIVRIPPQKNGWFMILKYISIPQEWPAISGSQGHWSGALYFYHELRDESSWQRGDLENQKEMFWDRMPPMSFVDQSW